ncbi:RHS repeat-associated core domain-containing protein [Luteibacter sp. UNCMF366Tsu5.1]|nr:RHS repeat-associated core domain-containing protein [Luteibacter sp. UNCMF366Tsu5.1]
MSMQVSDTTSERSRLTDNLRRRNGVWRKVFYCSLWMPLWFTTPVARARDVVYYYVDAQGSVLATTDAQGNTLSSSDYRPYGSPALGPVAGLGYTAHVHDDDGLIYMQARYYDSGAGRFLSKDAVEASPGYVGSMNRYAYVSNNPMNRIDPSGNYERGTGWKDDQAWKRFDKAQHSAAAGHHKAAGKLWAAAEKIAAGTKLDSSDKSAVRAFESVMGEGSATAGNLFSAADSLTQAARVLDAGPGSGLFANASSASEWKSMGMGGADLAAATVGGNNIYINTSHASYGNSSMLEWAAGHESLHTVGLTDQRIEGGKAYKFANGGEYFRLLREREQNRAVVNPDHLTDLSQ